MTDEKRERADGETERSSAHFLCAVCTERAVPAINPTSASTSFISRPAAASPYLELLQAWISCALIQPSRPLPKYAADIQASMAGRKPKARQLASHKNADTKVREKPFPLRRKLCRIGLCTLDAEQHLEVMNRLVEACPSLASVWNSERKRHKPTGTARKKTTPKPRKVKRPDLVNTLKAEQSRILFGLLFGRDLEKFVEDMLRTRKWARKRKDNEVMAEVLTIYWQREKNPVTAADVTKYFERVGNQSIQPTAEFLAMVDSLYPFPPEIPGRKYQSVDCGKALKNACGQCLFLKHALSPEVLCAVSYCLGDCGPSSALLSQPHDLSVYISRFRQEEAG